MISDNSDQALDFAQRAENSSNWSVQNGGKESNRAQTLATLAVAYELRALRETLEAMFDAVSATMSKS